jgi:hypothetical protein
MHEPGAHCNDLIEKTAAALTSDELQLLLLSTQQENAALCVKYGIKRWQGTTICAIYDANLIFFQNDDCKKIGSREILQALRRKLGILYDNRIGLFSTVCGMDFAILNLRLLTLMNFHRVSSTIYV